MRNSYLIVCIIVALCGASIHAPAEEPERLVVHEWGTFTSLQDESGKSLFGINVDTEPVPRFVHNLSPYLLNRSLLVSEHWIFRQKATPRNHPQVSLRLETPVIYFYPPADAKLAPIDIEVKFRGGWITEFYPRAQVTVPQVVDGKFDFSGLTETTIGEVAWNGVQLGRKGAFPETNAHVWLAPRNTKAASVSLGEEHEKYIFYRGVGRYPAPLRVHTRDAGATLEIGSTFNALYAEGEQASISQMWLMETRADASTAFRRIDPLVLLGGSKERFVAAPRRFAQSEFNTKNREILRSAMHTALVEDGLFADEATALLSTWQEAYFTSPGLRVFYLVPQRWTDHVLPLKISGDPIVKRSMIGRVELISDQQRAALTKLAASEISKSDWLVKITPFTPEWDRFLAGNPDAKTQIPPDFRLYLELGRFRNALVAEEAARTKSERLARFIRNYGLEAFRVSTRE